MSMHFDFRRKDGEFMTILEKPYNENRLDSFFYDGYMGLVYMENVPFEIHIIASGEKKIVDTKTGKVVADSKGIYVDKSLLNTDKKLEEKLENDWGFSNNNWFELYLHDINKGEDIKLYNDVCYDLEEAIEDAKNHLKINKKERKLKVKKKQKRKQKKVKLLLTGASRHEKNCECGDCNRLGHSYEVSICEVLNDIVIIESPLEVVKGYSKKASFHNARYVCKENKWEILEDNKKIVL